MHKDKTIRKKAVAARAAEAGWARLVRCVKRAGGVEHHGLPASSRAPAFVC